MPKSYCLGIELVHPWLVVAQVSTVVVKLPGWRSEFKEIKFHVEVSACGQERQKKREKQE